MSRTQPKVLIELVDKTTYKCDQIVEAAGIWAVFSPFQPHNAAAMFSAQKLSESLNGQILVAVVGSGGYSVLLGCRLVDCSLRVRKPKAFVIRR
jgi:hypothetical protein